MPMDTIDRAIKRGGGGGDAAALEEIVYEGYGPNGAAILIEAMTDNRNRTVAEIRNVFTRGGGSLGESRLRGLALRQSGRHQRPAGRRRS